MLHPITDAEKAQFTVKVAADRLTNELLAQTYEAKYAGFLDVWYEVVTKQGSLQVVIHSAKVNNSTSPHSPASRGKPMSRWIFDPAKGCKLLYQVDKA